ncbi:Undecaprenyl phosphate N,N'-diacetylbacillosamine 1-phosphate transferase [Thalassovita gelatinovora]|uniref:Undecaprenyl phosphate N,N'-diacetylbacillosamine 1-phosphate transferase n=1 Tax=Thalassovita gelatinovora TaxID=53501 RepID=A0A0P1F951_THAGE|nr:sugar transferase [Thalassovita gelatinovora]QIZ82576.1 sugar transferase [Thalassovita gelatinovora]CUH64599.1 Undecaprenyl phosphate N,N'-diacetylbacillosamine 1-phosphate transferase [Thalassovita gelatinovora]SEP95293.1 Sugar transferase involved in LPS biosynthesis (colanic, teichoic acid) [Thalassovita gelatinovora]
MNVHVNAALQAAKVDILSANTAFRNQPVGVYRSAGKRVLDLALVLLMAPTVLLVVVVLSAIIALDGRSPFYSQNRVGRNGRVYRMWKLRSMIPDAEAALKHHLRENPEARQEWDANQKLRNDPRITRFGQLIRRTSLDELPQLWNVVKGDMSLVGPRPMMCEQRVLYPGTEYYDMLPGITGYWQTSVRNESSFRDRAQFDAAYHRDLSMGTDIKVLLATVSVVMSATGH